MPFAGTSRGIALLIVTALVAACTTHDTSSSGPAIGGWGDKRVCEGLEKVYGNMEQSARSARAGLTPATGTGLDSNREAFIDTMLGVYEGAASLVAFARPEIRSQFAALGDAIEPLRQRLDDASRLERLLRGDDDAFVESIGLEPAAVAIERWARRSCSQPVALTVQSLGVALTLAFVFVPDDAG